MGRHAQVKKRGRGFIPNEQLARPLAPIVSQLPAQGYVAFTGASEIGAFFNIYQSDTVGGVYVWVGQITALDGATFGNDIVPAGKYWKATQLGNGIVTLGESNLSVFKLMT